MFLLIISSLVSCTFSTASNHTYMVVHPSNVRPNSDFLVHVELSKKVVNSVSITAEFVTNEVNDARRSALKTSVSLKAGMLGTDIILSIPVDFEDNFYQLEVNGTGDVSFNTSNYVYFLDKSMSIFIQTDKAQYKPGQLVQYRVFAVDPGLKPKSVLLTIEIFDSKGNKLSETNDVQNIFGTAGSFQLSDTSVLGNWRITAKVEGTEIQESYYFEVEEYVLPKFEVAVQLPSYGAPDNPSLSGMVRARYTFGKPVQGDCLLRVESQYSRSFYDPVAVHIKFNISGEGSFSIPMSVVKRLSRDIESESFRVIAHVTETLTGITESGDATITFYSERSMAYPETVYVEFAPYMKESFKPGFPYHVAIKVTEQDGRPLVNPIEGLKIEVTYFTKTAIAGNSTAINTDPEFVGPFPHGEVVFVANKHYTPSPDGFVTFDMDIPDYVFTASILAEFAGRKVYKDIICFQSPSHTFLNVELLTKLPEIGKNAVFSITGSKSPGEVTYHILSKSFVSLTGKVTVVQSSVAQTFNVLITSDMAPTARILVYYVTSDGEIVADGLYFTVKEMLQNKVDITFSKSRSQPGENVDVELKADPDSLICVLAVDKSVLLLGTGNDITEKRVREDLRYYGNDRILFARGWGFLQTWPIPADDASDIFIQAGFTVSTDGNLHKFDFWSYSLGGIPRSLMDASIQNEKVLGTSPRVRKLFPETMIFTNITADANGRAQLTRTVPDTISEWVASAFALNVNSGLGIAVMTANLTVFQNIFVNLQLPYSVVMGEEVIIQANVFNYYDTDEYVLVTLNGSNDFNGITIDGTGSHTVSTGDLVQCVQVKSNEPKVVFFRIKPKSIGSINLHVRAESRLAADALMTPLLVKAEGESKEYNRPLLISLPKGGTFSEEVHIKYPQNVVEGSQSVRVTLIGDILGPSMENLDDLLQLPYGSGEQNMLNFAPSVYAAEYLKKTRRLPDNSQELEDIRLKLRTGYQRELVYQRSDGSFSEFGDADESGSVWLTAFVGKSFAQATDLIFIDPKVVEDLVNHILVQQSEDGLFNITGIAHHRAIQGGSAESRRSLSAYIFIALKEIQAKHISTDESHLISLNKAIATTGTALANSANILATEYEMAIVAYALSLTQKYTANAKSILKKLLKSPDVVNEDGLRHWKNDSQSLQIEIAAYALLACTELRDTENGLPVLRWLIKQRNPYGGFVSTQDTIIAIQSLSSFAVLTYATVVDIQVTLRVGTAMENLTLNRENNDVLTLRQFSGNTSLISVIATGTGMGLLEVGVFYNVLGESEPASLTLTLATSEIMKNNFILTACTSWTDAGNSGMVLLDIGVPSGFAADKSSVVMLLEMKRIEELSGRLVVYFDQVTSETICVGVTIRKESLVAMVQPATVRVYSYYHPDKRAVKSYLPTGLKENSLCHICGSECGCGSGSIVADKDLCINALHSNT